MYKMYKLQIILIHCEALQFQDVLTKLRDKKLHMCLLQNNSIFKLVKHQLVQWLIVER